MALDNLNELLAEGIPAILAVDSDYHWIVIAGKSGKDDFFWIDSLDKDLIGKWRWKDLVDYIDSQEYYCIAVKPRDPLILRHSLVPEVARVMAMLNADADLQEYWGYYLEDLREAFDCPATDEQTITAEQFFDRYGKMILDAVVNAYDDAKGKKLIWELTNYRKVATAHRLTLSDARLPDAIALLTADLATIACTE